MKIKITLAIIIIGVLGVNLDKLGKEIVITVAQEVIATSEHLDAPESDEDRHTRLCGLKSVVCEGEEPETSQSAVYGLEIPAGYTIEREYLANTSAYTSHARQTDSNPCEAARSFDICSYEGNAIASRDLPIDTEVLINGKIWVVKDVMNKRYEGTGNIDLYFGMDEAAAWQWGRRNVPVVVLNKI